MDNETTQWMRKRFEETFKDKLLLDYSGISPKDGEWGYRDESAQYAWTIYKAGFCEGHNEGLTAARS